MNCYLVVTSVGLIAASLAFGQEGEIHHHNAFFSFGGAVPSGNTSQYLKTAPLISFGYGYRFNRWFRADTGFQMAFGAANEKNNPNGVQTDLGAVQGGDHEFMIPLGGRVYLPLPLSSRIEASVGGGAAYLHYSETAPSGGGYSYYGGYGNTCYTCTARGGWGGYGLGNVNYFLDSNHNIHLGMTLQYIAGHTNGPAVGNVPALKTTDHWINALLEFGLSF